MALALRRKAKKATRLYGKYQALKGAYATATMIVAGYSAFKAARSRRQQRQPAESPK